MNQKKVVLFFALFLTSLAAVTLPFDTTQTNKHGDKFSSAVCNVNTVVDFVFSSGSSLTFGSNVGSSASTLRYLDILGNQLIYTMTDGQLAAQSFISGFPKAFVFKFVSGGSTVYVAVPIIDGNASISGISEQQQTVVLSTVKDTAFYGLKSIDSSTASSMPLSTFNILDDITNGKFYSIMDTTLMTTLLIAKIHYQFSRTLGTSSTNLFNPTTITPNPQTSGDVLCWGSQYSTGFFQTHMRESIPLWTFLLALLFFWLFNLLSNEVTPEVYERSFKDNKWTCWSFYSIFWLCHQEWFTRTARTSLFLLNFFWQGMVAAAIYYTQWIGSTPTILLWVGVVAFAASVPVPYLVGNLFFQRIYNIQLQKFKAKRDMHHEMNKEKHEQLERAAILMEEHIYSIYYFYYSMCIILFTIFSVLTVHFMQQFPREFYYIHFYWLASVGIAFALDHLVFDPLMTLIFGNSAFYRSRGYYYNGELGEVARLAD